MGAANVSLSSLKKTDFIQNKKLLKKIKIENKQNFFLDILSFPENRRIIVSTPQNLLIYETVQFTLLETIDLRDLKILQPDNRFKKDELIDDNNCSFYGTRGGTWATIQHFTLNFDDYSIETKEIVRKHMPNNWLLNFLVLSTGLIVLAFNKGTILIFDEPKPNEEEINNDNNKNNNTNKNIITKPKKRNESSQNDKKMNNLINNMYNSYTNKNSNSIINNEKNNNDNQQDDLIDNENGPLSQEKQVFKFKKDLNININIQQESCGFFEVSDTCFIGITSEGGLRFFDLISEQKGFTDSKYMQGCWANPHSKNSIVIIGNKIFCSYKGITIIDANKRLIVKQIKSDFINCGITYLSNFTILITSDIILNQKNTTKIKRFGLLTQYVLSDIIDVKGKLRYSQSSDIPDLDDLAKCKELVLISKKEIQQDVSSLITYTMELNGNIIMFSSHEIDILDK